MNNLTAREQQIATLVAQGLTNKEIAQRLCRSQFTIRNELIIILRKLELKNRSQIAFLLGQLQNGHEMMA